MSLPTVLYSASSVLELRRVGVRLPRASGVLAERKRRSNPMNELHSTGHVIRGARGCAGSST